MQGYGGAFAKPFNLFVDARLHTVTAVLTQTGDDGTELPVAFSSTKLSQAQMAWSTIEREAYAVLVALKKYMSWIFGTKVTLYSDRNPLQYLIESAPKSAKIDALVFGSSGVLPHILVQKWEDQRSSRLSFSIIAVILYSV